MPDTVSRHTGTELTGKLCEAESGWSGNTRDDKQALAGYPDTRVSQGLGENIDQASSLRCFTSSGTNVTRKLREAESGRLYQDTLALISLKHCVRLSHAGLATQEMTGRLWQDIQILV